MQEQELPPVLTPSDLAELMSQNGRVRLLDVRTPGEYETVHIRSAYNVPLDTLSEHAREIQTHVEEPVVLICQSGARARKAEEALRSAGMPQLHVLNGGMNAWVASGEAVERGPTRVSLERQVRMVAGALAAAGGFLAFFVSPVFALFPAFLGLGLLFAGATDTCAMGLLLSRISYNRPAGCDVAAVVEALRDGRDPPMSARDGRPTASAPRSCGA